MKKKVLLKLGLVLISLFTPFIMMASSGDLLAQVQLDPSLRPEYATNLEFQGQGRTAAANAILQMIAGGLIYLAGPIAVLMLVSGGLRYIMSRGDQTQVEEAKKTITWSVIGLIVIILSYAIVTNVMWIAMQGGEIGTDKPPAQQGSGTTATPGATTGTPTGSTTTTATGTGATSPETSTAQPASS